MAGVMFKIRLTAILLLFLALGLGYFVYYSETASTGYFNLPFKLGLDLSGGSHLVYEADTTAIATGEVDEAMSSLREVIERRINVFGVSEPLIQAEQAGFGASASHRLIVELPGVTNLNEALNLIAETPNLEFKTLAPGATGEVLTDFVDTGLTGRYLERASVQFTQTNLGPSISLNFNPEGSRLFAELTESNIGQPVAIFLDGILLSAPIVQEKIGNGQAEITGQFSVEEAKTLVRNLNLGALPVPIHLISSQTIGATLGADALAKGVYAGLLGLAVVASLMILWYRLPGLVAVVSLGVYIILMLALFKLIPVTLTAAGIAGFILSIGIAIDANVLIFERLREELREGKSLYEATIDGFARAWLSIRDSNLSSLISAIILFWFGTSMIKGFALTMALGIVISMFTAITVTRTFLLAIGVKHKTKLTSFLFSSGFYKLKAKI